MKTNMTWGNPHVHYEIHLHSWWLFHYHFGSFREGSFLEHHFQDLSDLPNLCRFWWKKLAAGIYLNSYNQDCYHFDCWLNWSFVVSWFQAFICWIDNRTTSFWNIPKFNVGSCLELPELSLPFWWWSLTVWWVWLQPPPKKKEITPLKN